MVEAHTCAEALSAVQRGDKITFAYPRSKCNRHGKRRAVIFHYWRLCGERSARHYLMKVWDLDVGACRDYNPNLMKDVLVERFHGGVPAGSEPLPHGQLPAGPEAPPHGGVRAAPEPRAGALQCPGGHDLQSTPVTPELFNTWGPEWEHVTHCDRCGAEIGVGSTSFRCAQCEFDLCERYSRGNKRKRRCVA